MPINYNLFDGDNKKRPQHPYEIFKLRPSGPNTIEDLWQGQREAIDNWHDSTKNDILISLNTGAGKSIIGSLISQSLSNKGFENVVYLCATTNLVNQTLYESRKVGLEPTTYLNGEFSNDDFDQGRSFCITTYHAALNAFTKFRGDRKPGAIIFDDAHVAEQIIRQQFLLNIHRKENKETYNKICSIFDSHLSDYGLREKFRLLLTSQATVGAMLMPPVATLEAKDALERALMQIGENGSFSQRSAYENLRGKLAFCAFMVSRGRIEITPPFLPSLSIGALGDKRTRRVYLSATLGNRSDFARAFGRLPGEVIEPKVDAGNGERLILFSKFFTQGKLAPSLVSKISSERRALFSVPSYSEVSAWEKYGQLPEGDFDEELEKFKSNDNGLFFLVGRYDGIDFPGDDCRILFTEGLPKGTNLLERFCYDKLEMESAYVGRMATRITQLFGRINRGRADYGVYIISGEALRQWLMRPSRMAYLPSLIRRQIFMGHKLLENQSKALDDNEVIEFIEQSLKRNSDWINFYANHIGDDDVDPIHEEHARNGDTIISDAAKREVRFQSKIWKGDTAAAAIELADNLDQVAVSDPRLAGWQAVWLGVVKLFEGANDLAGEYFHYARSRIQRDLPLPYLEGSYSLEAVSKRAKTIASNIGGKRLLAKTRLNKNIDNISQLFFKDASHQVAEEAIRILGEVLGFESRRPCSEFDEGPDNIWICPDTNSIIVLDLKSEKEFHNDINKSDVSQAKVNLDWVEKRYPDAHIAGNKSFVVAWNGKLTDQAAIATRVSGLSVSTIETLSAKVFKRLKSAIDEQISERRAIINDLVDGFGAVDKIVDSFEED